LNAEEGLRVDGGPNAKLKVERKQKERAEKLKC
jgi:hypothetical protein